MGLLGLLGRRAGLSDPGPLRRLVAQHLPFEQLEDALVPLHVVVTDVLTGRDTRLSRGSAVQAVMASAAIPGVFPPVVINGRAFMDGGVANNAGISHAIDLGADIVYVLPTGWSCSLDQAPTAALGVALHGLTVLVQHRLADDVDRYRDHVSLHVVPPPCPIRVGPADFAHAAELIESGYAAAARWLAHGHLDAPRLLVPHDHTRRGPIASNSVEGGSLS